MILVFVIALLCRKWRAKQEDRLQLLQAITRMKRDGRPYKFLVIKLKINDNILCAYKYATKHACSATGKLAAVVIYLFLAEVRWFNVFFTEAFGSKLPSAQVCAREKRWERV